MGGGGGKLCNCGGARADSWVSIKTSIGEGFSRKTGRFSRGGLLILGQHYSHSPNLHSLTCETVHVISISIAHFFLQ